MPKTKSKAPAKPIRKPATRAKPASGKGSGKPTIHQRAKALGLPTMKGPRGLKAEEQIPDIELHLDPDLVDVMEQVIGRPTVLTPELGMRVCTLVAQRYSLEDIGRMDGLPTSRTIYRWLSGGVKARPIYAAFRQAYAQAREIRADTRLELIADIFDRLTNPARRGEMLDPQQARVGADIQRMLMELENRGKWGKQLTIQGGDKPLKVEHNAKSLTDEMLLALASGGTLEEQD